MCLEFSNSDMLKYWHYEPTIIGGTHPDVLRVQTVGQDSDEGVDQLEVALLRSHQASPLQTHTQQLQAKLHQHVDVGLLTEARLVTPALGFLG